LFSNNGNNNYDDDGDDKKVDKRFQLSRYFIILRASHTGTAGYRL